ncbi:MAG: hypothetical protein A2Z47_08455 [Thermodesulfovibrio sp. RBG_19FT_COMBO_42_12]|nr:MAG: hypothetical protein A2Z47_08455 [Thermodesulfovibrio sp. RBG_19FT_COMBO_42_12]
MVVIIRSWSPSAPPEAGKLDRIIQFLSRMLSDWIPRSLQKDRRASKSGNDKNKELKSFEIFEDS